ncbi:glycosyltransferase family 4 protein [Ferroplasma acidarmanus]|uniref:Glycosyl transferase family 1 domain-containing protein n=1 Tax=Ferroplasma acidarmanus Fer1 TaxID=333146 RepID=S0ASZ0_FERAC|nr:glycosyltransferase family 4 protein [Ferroplasma acidarmanus]AGO61922.1 hypothetical protein FACI_IFERC00001G1946 [Ferroplasma acidarmanus Fer1]
MKVLLIDEFSRIGGGQILSKLLLDYFNENYGQTYLAVDREHTYIKYENIIETPYYFRENMKLPSLYYYVARTKKFLRHYIQNQFDLVFNNHPNMFLYKADINALHGFSFLDQIIDEYGNIKNKIIFNFIKKSGMYNLYNNANFFVNSKYTLQISRKLFPLLNIKPNLMRLIYIPVEHADNTDLSMKDNNLVISIGRIDIRKNYEVLLKIAEKLKNYRFIIAGALNRGDEEYYRNLIKNKPSNVEIKANINEHDKIELLKKASIYMHMNRRENYGISILEAMSYGLVPVVPESGGPWEDIIEHGRYGYGFNSVDDAVERIKNIDFDIVKTIINSMDRFSFKNFYYNMDNFVEEVQNS